MQCCSLASNKESLIEVSRAMLYTWVDGRRRDVMSCVESAVLVLLSRCRLRRAMTKARRGMPGWWYGDGGVLSEMGVVVVAIR